MFKNRFVTTTVTFIAAITGIVNADGEDTPAQAAPVGVFPLSANTVFERHVVGERVITTATGERLIYSNTLGSFAAALGANLLVSDDIATLAPNGCKLRRLEFPVVGKADPKGLGGAYSLDFVLYSSCPYSVPSSSRPGLVIANSAVHIDFPDDGPRLISFVPPEGMDVVMPTNFWFGVKFSRNNAGVVVGAPPLTGFSCDQIDFPGFACNAHIGRFPSQPQASFNLEIYADSACADAFTGYKNSKPSGSTFNPGANIFLADDIQLGTDECQMIAYEVAVKGVGFYTFDLRDRCDGGVIPGTEKTFGNVSGTDVRIVRFAFDPPIALPQSLWFAAKVNNTTGKVVISGQQACIGTTADLLKRVVGGECNIVPPSDIGIGIHGAFDLAITCVGSPPVGACCDMVIPRCVEGPDDGRTCCPADAELRPYCFGDPAFADAYPPCTSPGTCESVCRETPLMNCPWPLRFTPFQPTWVEGAACSPDPFPFACGAAACCRPDQVCENLTRNECYAVPPLDGPRQWQRGRYCGVDGQICPWVACLPRSGDCLTAREEPGCSYPQCCVDVCNADSYCCLVEWDRVCVERANTLCPDVRGHDGCSSLFPSISALPVEADSVTVFSNIGATESESDPGFCCRNDKPGATGFGTTWFKFVATDTSARVSTCNSAPANDSLLQVFAAGDPTTEETACATLSMIACSDDEEGCSTSGHHGRVCIKGLTPGDTYYVMLAAKTPETKGLYELEIRSPCFEQPIWNPNDCNENKLQDGCETLPLFDCDFDNDVDLIDLAGFQRCFTGLGPMKLAPCCTVFDSEPDGDVDLADFVAFWGALAGPHRAKFWDPIGVNGN